MDVCVESLADDALASEYDKKGFLNIYSFDQLYL